MNAHIPLTLAQWQTIATMTPAQWQALVIQMSTNPKPAQSDENLTITFNDYAVSIHTPDRLLATVQHLKSNQ